MKLLSYQCGNATRIASVIDETIIDLNHAYRRMLEPLHPHRAAQIADCWIPCDMVAFLEGGPASLQAAQEAHQYALANQADLGEIIQPLSQVRLLPPVPRPGKIFCIGKNYADHAAELGGTAPKTPEIFIRFPSTLIASGDPIIKPLETHQWDYEAELAVIIGKSGRRIPEKSALDHVAGYSCFNDISARDFQKRISQWTAGKNFDGSGPFGPYLVTADEIPDPQNLDIALALNGEIMQQANTSSMIFSVAYLISHLSEFITLAPGDVIATGTPGGVGMARTPPRFLKDGDWAEVVLSKVGKLANLVVNET